jgi:predicted transcriptional regulator
VEEFHLTGIGTAMFADVLQLSEAEADVWTNMHALGEGAEVHDDVDKNEGKGRPITMQKLLNS